MLGNSGLINILKLKWFMSTGTRTNFRCILNSFKTQKTFSRIFAKEKHLQ